MGQVSGSLLGPAASGSLSALFSLPAAEAALTYQTYRPPERSTDQRPAEAAQKKAEAAEVKGQPTQKTTQKRIKEKSADHLDNRESSLQTADQEEQQQRKATRKRREEGAEYWVMKRRRTKEGKEEEEKKRKTTVFVGNLPVSCTKKTLRSIFRDSGSIESIRFRSVVREDPSMSRKVATITRKAHPQQQSINAYVVFRDEDGAAAALQRNGLQVEDDFYIRVDRVGEASSIDHRRSVFVGNLPFDLKDLTLRRHFEACGQVEAVRLVRDRSSGLGKGFGYVLFQSADSVQLALKLDGSKLEGRSLRVKRSVLKEKQQSRAAPRRDSRGQQRGVHAPNKAPQKAPVKGPNKGPSKAPNNGPNKGRPQKGAGGGVRSSSGQNSSWFKGEMVDSTKTKKKKGLKKKGQTKKSVHI